MPFAQAYRVRAVPAPLRAMPAITVPAVVVGEEPPGPRGGKLLCDEAGRLYEWMGDRLLALQPADLGRPAEAPPGPGFRALFPEDGLSLVVRWPDLRRLLEPHVAHPERLRGTHRLAVRLQVFQTTRRQHVRELAEEALGSAAGTRELAPLTPALAAHLGLEGKLPPGPPIAPRPPGHDRELLPAGVRVVRMVPVTDPTKVAAARPPAAAPIPAAAPAAAVEPQRTKGVPDRFGQPWAFRVSREEALDEMERSRGAWGRLCSRLRLLSPARRRQERCWALRLAGRSLAEQLWEVRPPRGAVGDRSVREWARTALERAGYDAPAMLDEWEVFWRRKGA